MQWPEVPPLERSWVVDIMHGYGLLFQTFLHAPNFFNVHYLNNQGKKHPINIVLKRRN